MLKNFKTNNKLISIIRYIQIKIIMKMRKLITIMSVFCVIAFTACTPSTKVADTAKADSIRLDSIQKDSIQKMQNKLDSIKLDSITKSVAK